jgi:hypothetical protein
MTGNDRRGVNLRARGVIAMLPPENGHRPVTPRIPKQGKRLDKLSTEAWPEGSIFTIEAVCFLFGKKPRTIYNVLNENAKQLSRPKYAQPYRHRGNLRLYRILTEADIVVIRQIFRVRLKRVK